jgi:hypothetical protein
MPLALKEWAKVSRRWRGEESPPRRQKQKRPDFSGKTEKLNGAVTTHDTLNTIRFCRQPTLREA